MVGNTATATAAADIEPFTPSFCYNGRQVFVTDSALKDPSVAKIHWMNNYLPLDLEATLKEDFNFHLDQFCVALQQVSLSTRYFAGLHQKNMKNFDMLEHEYPKQKAKTAKLEKLVQSESTARSLERFHNDNRVAELEEKVNALSAKLKELSENHVQALKDVEDDYSNQFRDLKNQAKEELNSRKMERRTTKKIKLTHTESSDIHDPKDVSKVCTESMEEDGNFEAAKDVNNKDVETASKDGQSQNIETVDSTTTSHD